MITRFLLLLVCVGSAQDGGPEPGMPSSPTPARASAPLLPPRPNRGPEPWRAVSRPGSWVWPVFAVGGMLVLGAIVLRARARSRSGQAPAGPESLESLELRDRPAAAASMIRRALVTRFGASWAALTTEEIAAAPDLEPAIGPDRAKELLSILARADRSKFSGAVDAAEPDLAVEVAAVLEALRQRPPRPRPAESAA